MNRVNVVSTNLLSVGYENKVLEVEFRNRTIYQYFGVPQEIYDHLISFTHPGRYFSRFVKNRYRCLRVR